MIEEHAFPSIMTIMITVNQNLQQLQHLGSVNDQKGKKGINNRGKKTFFVRL